MAKSEKEVPVAEVSNEVQRECLSQSVQMALGPFTEKHPLCDGYSPNQPRGRDLLSKLKRPICFASNAGLILEFPD